MNFLFKVFLVFTKSKLLSYTKQLTYICHYMDLILNKRKRKKKGKKYLSPKKKGKKPNQSVKVYFPMFATLQSDSQRYTVPC